MSDKNPAEGAGGEPWTVRDAARDLLRRLGMTTVFGNPGTTEVPLLREWPDDFRYVLGLQESAVVAMADAYAHQTGRAVLVNLHSAGGVGHSLGAVFSAYRGRTPMVIVAGQQARSLLPQDPFLGATQAPEFPKPYVKWSVEPARAVDVPAALARAHQIATQPPCGPTFVSVPADDWDQPGGPIAAPRPIAPYGPDPQVLDELVAVLRECARPAFVAGPAVVEAEAAEDLVALAERTRAAVWEPPQTARSAFPERHPQFQGTLLPEQRALAEQLSPYDVVVCFGAPAFTYHVDRGPAERSLPATYLISDDPDILARAPGVVGIRSCLGLALRELLSRTPESSRPLPPERARPELPPPSTPPEPANILDELAGQLPGDSIVVTEAPTHRNLMQDFLPTTVPGQEYFVGASGALGYGLPAAVGTALAQPSRTVVAIIGDGSVMYGIQALWTAASEGASLTILVLDNEEYAAVRLLGEVGPDGKIPGVELGGLDFVAVARGMGCSARLAEGVDDFAEKLADSFTERGPTLLHVPVARTGRQMY